MSNPQKPTTLQRVDNVEQDRQWREALSREKQVGAKRIQEAFGETEDDTIKEVRDYLLAVVGNIDSIENRLQLRDEESSRVVEMPWPQLVGSTLKELEISPRAKLLILDVFTGLIPKDKARAVEEIAEAAGMHGLRSATPDTVSRFEKEGLLMAFVAKVFLDSKSLLVEGDEKSVEDYFEEALGMASHLMQNPYLDSRDRRFLETCQKKYGGGLDRLVRAQKKTVLSRVKSHKGNPELERILRRLSREDYGKSSIQPMEDWWEEAKAEFTPIRFVFSEIDSLRRRVQKSMKRIEEGERLSDPEETIWQTGKRLSKHLEDLQKDLKETPAKLQISKGENINLLSFIRENARVLSAPYAVDMFKVFLKKNEIVEDYALHKVAAFQKRIPDLQARLRASLYICDELYRSAPLGDEQKSLLDALRGEMVSYAESQGHPVPQKILETRWNVPFAEEVFGLLTTPEEFEVFEGWLKRIREVYDRSMDLQPGADFYALESIDGSNGFFSEQQSVSPRQKKKLVSTLLGIPVFPSASSNEEEEPEGNVSPATMEKTEVVPRRKGSLWSWRFWPWNWFRSTRRTRK